jgi:hypothetical protein
MRGLRVALLVAAASAAAAAQPLEPSARQAKLDETRSMLDYGLWNGRINALYDLGEMGRDGLPLLAYADDDADWQVRLTAVHFLGKVGLPAAPVLAAVARREPCLHVRLFALEWLSLMGATGEQYYREAVTPEDEAELARIPYHANPKFMGKPLAIDVPDEMNAEFFNGGADLRVCASSEHAGRLHTHLEWPRGEAAEAAAHEVVVTADVPAWALGGKRSAAAAKRGGNRESFPPGVPAPPNREAASAPPLTPEQKRRNAEIDKFLAAGTPQTMPPGEAAPAGRETAAPAPGFETPSPRALAAASVPEKTPGRPETMPRGEPASAPGESAPVAPRLESPDARAPAASAAPPAAPRAREEFPPAPPASEARTSAPGAAELVPDDGTGKPEKDPIPGLIERLSDSDPHRRARAADELGKRGAAAAKAVPALRRALGDRDRRVRASAVLALGSAGSAEAGVEGDLKRALRDKDEDVRFSAGIALERLRRR